MPTDNLTVEEWELKLGEQLREMRLRLNLQQSVVAAQAGISVSALKNLESGKGANLKTLIRALRAYRREDWLATLAPPVTISPLQMLNSKAPRVRARSKAKREEV
jgi:transcriptional regulator with XRE-family HTH domain